MELDQTIADLTKLSDAVKYFTETVVTTQAFGPDALPGHMSCGEANAFSELLDALGINGEATMLRYWHLEADDEDAREAHPDWEETAPGPRED